jgi:hypothetical protein
MSHQEAHDEILGGAWSSDYWPWPDFLASRCSPGPVRSGWVSCSVALSCWWPGASRLRSGRGRFGGIRPLVVALTIFGAVVHALVS